MRLFQNIGTAFCVLAPLITNAVGQPAASPKSVVDSPNAVELQPLQGIWEGVLVGDNARQKVSITIMGTSLRFFRDTNFWFVTTMILPAGKDPKQLHATITEAPPSQAVSVGQVVRAFFKIENGALTLATMGDDSEETQKAFEAAGTRYELQRVEPHSQNAQPPKAR